ncbi:MAG: GPP34 family phosphoprotein [Acidobacteriota bacterium]|nr:GPP34 family phosphoprotein [Acidobacteriota bacterium]
MGQRTLFLQEEIMLLALRDGKGANNMFSIFHYAVAGGILAELALAGKITFEERDKKTYVVPVDDTSTGDEQMDLCLAKIFNAQKQEDAATWVFRLGGDTEMKHRIAEGLCRRGILRADKIKFLFLTDRVYPEVNPKPKRELIARLEKAIFTNTGPVEAGSAVLVSLADSVGILKNVFQAKELKKRAHRIKNIADDNVICYATKEAVNLVRIGYITSIVAVVLILVG